VSVLLLLLRGGDAVSDAALPPWRRWTHGEQSPIDSDPGVPAEVEVTDPTIRKLYGPNGEVLKTYSDRPPIGFAP
jgi:hypothetical protein